MQAFLSFLTVPLAIAVLAFAGQWWSARSLPRAEAIQVPQMAQLPPNVRELMAQEHARAPVSLRLSALMPADVIDRVLPPPPPPDRRSAAERFRLASTLLGDGLRPSAVIDGQVVQEGERFANYRLLRVAADHVWVSGPQGRERIGLDTATQAPLAALASVRAPAGDKTAAAVQPLPPPPSAETLERQFRRLLENLAH